MQGDLKKYIFDLREHNRYLVRYKNNFNRKLIENSYVKFYLIHLNSTYIKCKVYN